MEILKLVIAWFLSPLWICLTLQCLGWWLRWYSQKRRGLALIALGTVSLFIGSLQGLTHESRRDREYQHHPLDPQRDLSADEPVLAVVLGCGFNGDPHLPANSRVSGGFQGRLLEGVRVYRSHPRCRLLISLSGDSSDDSKREFTRDLLTLLKLDPDRVDLITDAESTSDESSATAAHRTDEQVVVVTSAGHMVRAFQIFADAGLNPVAAPADYVYRRAGSPSEKVWPRWVPSTGGINNNQQWLYEQAASVWHFIGGNQGPPEG